MSAVTPNQRMRRARLVTVVGVAGGLLTGPALAAVGVAAAPDVAQRLLGWLGLALVTATLLGAAHAAVGTDVDTDGGPEVDTDVGPEVDTATRRRWFVAVAVATVLSVPLVGPLGTDGVATWALLSSSVVGLAALLPVRVAIAVAVVTTGVSALVAVGTGGSVLGHVLLTLAIGSAVAAWNGLHRLYWMFLVQAQAGQEAVTRLAATEERLRFARDVHDLLGHNLAVIALKAELGARLLPVDPDRAGREVDDVRRIVATSIAEMREVVHGYRRVDLSEQARAVAEVLRASGIRCTVTLPDADPPPDLAVVLGPVLREASTNVLRHSRARWCTVDLTDDGAHVRLRVRNDGVRDTGPDRHSSGLRGLADRLGVVGGTLHTESADGRFTLEATVARGDGDGDGDGYRPAAG